MSRTLSPEIQVEIELLGSTLKTGESKRDTCPRCQGGSTKERSFSISRDLGSVLRFHCFRATCGFSGNQTLGEQYRPRHEQQPIKYSTAPFRAEVEPLSWDDIDLFREIYGINPDRNTFYCKELGRYAHRVYGPLGEARGWVARVYFGMPGTPKALNYAIPGLTGPFISWYIPQTSTNNDVVVVEDVLSAKKVADAGFTAVALLGTWIDLERAYEIAEIVDGGHVHLALDEGCMDAMMKYKDKFGLVWEDKVKVWYLKKDLKYVDRERIRKAVNNGECNFRSDVTAKDIL